MRPYAPLICLYPLPTFFVPQEAVFFSMFIYILAMQYVLPILQKSVVPLHEFDLPKLVERVLKLCTYVHVRTCGLGMGFPKEKNEAAVLIRALVL